MFNNESIDAREAADCYVADLARHAATQARRDVGIELLTRAIDQLARVRTLFENWPPSQPIPRSAIRRRLRGLQINVHGNTVSRDTL